MKTVDEIVRNMREFADGQENNSAPNTKQLLNNRR